VFGCVALAAASIAQLTVLSTTAGAQQSAAPLVPLVTPLKGDDLFANSSGPSVGATFAPLRLSLTGGLFSQASAFAGCDARAEASGNTVNGFAVQRYTFLRLTPQLVLHGFSMTGCPVDAGMGGGLSYSVPLQKSLWLVSSAGFYALPTFGGGTSSLVTTAARVDIVKQLGWGGTLNVGLGTRSGTGQFHALHFGGSF
jgi:hypothetical protein